MKKTMMKNISLFALAAAAFIAPSTASAGVLVPPAAPTAVGSAMYSLDAIWNRLDAGTVGQKRDGDTGFVEPGAGPLAVPDVGKTLDDVMAAAPAADTVDGAYQHEVVFGKKYWSLRTGDGQGTDSRWGLNTGTRPPSPVLSDANLTTPRFTDNGNGTVTDNLTGLVWLQNANCFGQLDWSVAGDTVELLAPGACGLAEGSGTGWRLPTRRELASLVDDRYVSPALTNTTGNGQWTADTPFAGVQNNGYWSSTATADGLSNAWMVNFDDGYMNYSDQTNIFYVWPVRGGL